MQSNSVSNSFPPVLSTGVFYDNFVIVNLEKLSVKRLCLLSGKIMMHGSGNWGRSASSLLGNTGPCPDVSQAHCMPSVLVDTIVSSFLLVCDSSP